MKIRSREVKILTTINYNDGCEKTIQYLKVYSDNTKTPMLRYKIVEFRYPDSTIDADRSYDDKMIIDDSESESDSDYESDSDSESPNAK